MHRAACTHGVLGLTDNHDKVPNEISTITPWATYVTCLKRVTFE